MEYIVLLDYTGGEVIKIRLSEQETILADEAEDFEEFLRTLEEKYDFRLDNCCWMSTTNLRERSYLYLLTLLPISEISLIIRGLEIGL